MAPKKSKLTTMRMTAEEQDALAFIRKKQPEWLSDAAARRAAVFEKARSLGWEPKQKKSPRIPARENQ